MLIGLLAAGLAHADQRMLGSCQFPTGQIIPSRPSLAIPDIAAATFDRVGTPVIYFNPYVIGGMPRKFQEFIYAHECAHHVLGHLHAGQVVDAVQEAEADCWATAELTVNGMLTPADVAIIAEALPTLVPGGDRTHRPGNMRAQDIRKCIRIPDSPTAAALFMETPSD